jgi:HK97 gp10 family phage protein
MSSDVQVKGLAALQAALDQLPAKVEANIMRGAMRAGAKVIQAEAKRLVPVSPPNAENVRLYGGYEGLLRDSIRVRIKLRRGTVTASVRAGGGKVKGTGDAYYARWVEYGTKAHSITAATAGALAIKGGRPVHTVAHPGAQPKPYLRPALDGKARDAVEAVAAYIRQRLALKHGLDVPAPAQVEDDA